MKSIIEQAHEIIQEIALSNTREDEAIIEDSINQAKLDRSNDLNYWDIPKDQKIDFFDPSLSYELVGYRPIDEVHSLDFDPSWFTEAREVYLRTGHYCPYLPGSKRYNEFWKEQYIRCKYGMKSHGYTITGDNYFFLNFYQLPVIDSTKAAGEGIDETFPNFMASQYMFFHYLNLCRITKRNACLMKARSIGFSEINASVAARMYFIFKKSRTMIACHKDQYVKDTFGKFTHAVTFLNTSTDGGMFQPELISQELRIKSGFQEKINGQYEDFGAQSEVIGINADKPSKIRGKRLDLLIYDEAGSWPDLKTAVVQGRALCEVQGEVRGIQLYGGTGGDMGAPLAGLKAIYEKPRAYKVLPFRHNWTQDGTIVETGFFIPYFLQSLKSEFMDSRGVCNIEKYKAYLQEERNGYLEDPEAYAKHCAENCWYAEEAFQLEGQNKFNKTNIINQLADIRLHKIGPRPEAGNISYVFKNNKHTADNISGFRWQKNPSSKLLILEHPRWSPLYKRAKDEPVMDPMNDLYVAGVDGIDIGANQTSSETRSPSDFCMVILRRAYGLNDPQIVCVYKDRPGNVREAFKTAMCLARYYNCRINIEATRVGFVTWAKENNCLQYFMKRPKATLTDIKSGNTKQYGTPATKIIIEQHTQLTADFVEDYCHTIWFEEVLQQLNEYNDENKTKFDIIAALGMVFLANQELSGRTPVKTAPVSEDWQDFGYYTDENGYKRYGIIPKKKEYSFITQQENDDPYRIETSDPRIYETKLQGRIYWRYQD